MNLSSKKERRRKPFFLDKSSRPVNFGQILETQDLKPGQFLYFHNVSSVTVILILGIVDYKIRYIPWQVDGILGDQIMEASPSDFGLEPFFDGVWSRSFLQETSWPDMSEKDVAFILSNIENRIRTIME